MLLWLHTKLCHGNSVSITLTNDAVKWLTYREELKTSQHSY